MAQFGIDHSYYCRRACEYLRREIVNDLFPYTEDEWVEFHAGVFGLRYHRLHRSDFGIGEHYDNVLREHYGFWAEVVYYRRGYGIEARDQIYEWDVDEFSKLVQAVNGSWSLCKFDLLDREEFLTELAQEKIAPDWNERLH